MTQGYGITSSTSRLGNRYDDAMAEAFFSILKTECIYRHQTVTFEKTRTLIDRYVFCKNKINEIDTAEVPKFVYESLA